MTRLPLLLMPALMWLPPGVQAQARCRVAEIQVAPADGVVAIGAHLTLAATAYDASGVPCDNVQFVWSSSDANIVDVDATGSARGISAGVAIITARAGIGSQARSAQAVVRAVQPSTPAVVPAPAARPAAAPAADPRLTAGFWVPAFGGGGPDDLLRYARRLGLRVDSALFALLEVFRNTSGAPVVGARGPQMLSSREQSRWVRCRAIHFDLRTHEEAAEFLRDSAVGPVQQAASQLARAFDVFQATEECDNIASMIEFPERWTPFQQNYEFSARNFYRDWYEQLRPAHEAARTLLRALGGDQGNAVPPLPSRAPLIGGNPVTPPVLAGGKTPPVAVRDTDEDGVIDVRDRCRATAPGVRVDRGGCPAPPNAEPEPPQPVSGGPQEILTIRIGETRDGRLETGDWTMADGTWADIWYVQAPSASSVVIELRSRSFDAYMQLLDGVGRKLAEDDDGAGGGNSRITRTLEAGARYQIVVNNFGDAPTAGQYTLSVKAGR